MVSGNSVSPDQSHDAARTNRFIGEEVDNLVGREVGGVAADRVVPV